jgi:protein tyrosine phosphatase (PTP) superfamily phosphohydrolase (DUF442 family)
MKCMRDSTYTTEEVVRLGREIYEREVRAKVEASHDGEFVVVDVTTGAWEVDEDDVAASERVLAKNADAVLYFARVGRRAAYRLGYRLGHRLDTR